MLHAAPAPGVGEARERRGKDLLQCAAVEAVVDVPEGRARVRHLKSHREEPGAADTLEAKRLHQGPVLNLGSCAAGELLALGGCGKGREMLSEQAIVVGTRVCTAGRGEKEGGGSGVGYWVSGGQEAGWHTVRGGQRQPDLPQTRKHVNKGANLARRMQRGPR